MPGSFIVCVFLGSHVDRCRARISTYPTWLRTPGVFTNGGDISLKVQLNLGYHTGSYLLSIGHYATD